MGININIERKFEVKGKVYSSIEEMPPDIRAAFEKAMASQVGQEPKINFATGQTKIVFNNVEYENIDAMPQDTRRLYEKIMKAAGSGAATPDGDLLKDVLGPEALKTTRPQKHLKQISIEPSFSSRGIIYIAVLGALIILLYFAFRSI